ncbi:hypothetical protein FHW79_005237 [Azospirillum sp. OGB3]|uniref:hypothetical protein n=1 Tax=Azospirillum sp. OGB3 TaxID=2587012 RepID=UPI001606C04A|nr:hypothetical protein [Azospirillum sp. OGB3]MBB3267576.1 hypothetical protein [Azospirillum sp. OGB3]
MAGWYRTGTVSLATGSAGVVGNGTSWAGAVRPGATFTTDFVRLYEVVEVADDRHLTLDRPYEASVETLLEGSGQPYAIIFATATMSNAEIAAELMAMVGKWQVREDQYDDWVAGEPDGGPNGDGKYPLTDSKGVTRLVTSPGRLLGLIDEGLLNNVQQVVDAIRDDIADAQRAADVAASAAVTLKDYADSAHQSGISAGEAMASAAASADLAGRKAVEVLDAAAAAANHAETAVQARTGAEAVVSIVTAAKSETLTARDGAVEAKATVLEARDRVVVLAGETQTARDTVVASTGTAAAAARTATDAAGTAQNAATDSVNAKVQAVAAQVVAEQRRNEAAESAATANAWANNPAGVPVVSGGYSSYHWMELARGYAMTAQTIATGSTFSNVGDGAATRITAQAAGETLHLVQGAGMIVNFDQATRRVTFSSIARAVATESPALTVRLDDAANLAFLGIDPSKIDHGTLANVGTHGHADIDQHLDNATIHVPVPGGGDVDKLLKATGAGTFAWVKGTGSGIDADKLDGLSWEEGIEVPANGASGEWVKLGTWNANGATAQGRRLLIQAAGSFDFSNDTANTRAGLTTIVATMGNGLPGVANMEGQFAHLGTVLFDAVKFVQGDGDRYTYAVYAKRQPYAPFNFKVQCNGAWTSAIATGQADPGADSATVRAAANLGRLLTTADQSTTATAGGVVQRDANGAIAATAADLKGPAPALHWSETDQPADAGRWRAIAENGKLALQTVNDAGGDARTWLDVGRSGLAPTAATFSVPVQVALGQLGTAVGTEIKVSELGANDGNADFLRAKLVRVQAGVNWTSAAWRLQRRVDVTDQGFVQFGSGVDGDGSNGVGLGGGGSTVRLWVPTVGDVTIDGNKVWTAGNFDPATKAGTAVATVAANGLMAAADRQMLGGATAAATAGALVQRDSNGGAAFGVVTASNVKVGSADVWHKGTLTDLSQLTNGPGFITAAASITGNAATATTLQTVRTINGVFFNGSANITVPDLRIPEMTGNASRVPRIAASGAALEYLDPMAFGQCRIGLQGTTSLALYRYNGKYLFINGRWETIPSTHVFLAPSAFVAGTHRYVYAYMSGATMTLEASTTAPAVDTTHGHRIKTGDATRTLVGMATVSGGGTFNGGTTLYTKSWFNRLPYSMIVSNSGTVTHYGNGNWQNASNLWSYLLTWGDETTVLHYSVSGSATGGNCILYANHLIDGTPGVGTPGSASSISNSRAHVSATYATALADGLHSFGVSVLTENGFVLSLPAYYTSLTVTSSY